MLGNRSVRLTYVPMIMITKDAGWIIRFIDSDNLHIIVAVKPSRVIDSFNSMLILNLWKSYEIKGTD